MNLTKVMFIFSDKMTVEFHRNLFYANHWNAYVVTTQSRRANRTYAAAFHDCGEPSKSLALALVANENRSAVLLETEQPS